MYSLVKNPRRTISAVNRQRLFTSATLQAGSVLAPSCNTNSPLSRRSDWKCGLRRTASALCGHVFAGCRTAAASAWNLSPGARAFVVTVFDHNRPCLAIICPKLAYEQTCKLHDFNVTFTDPNIVWRTSNPKILKQAISDMAVAVPSLPDFLQPSCLTKRPKHRWQICTVSVLPKWKGPQNGA